jgi:hypothetical protein
MSSDAYRIECVAVGADTARFRLHNFDGDAPQSKSFYLQILLDFYDMATMGELPYEDEETGSLSEDEYRDKALTSPGRLHLERLLGLMYDREVPLTLEQLATYQADPAAFAAAYHVQIKRVSTDAEDAWYYSLSDEGDFVAAARREILDLTTHYEAQPSLLRADHLCAEVEFQVADADLLAHLVPGTIWGSTMYELDESPYFPSAI